MSALHVLVLPRFVYQNAHLVQQQKYAVTTCGAAETKPGTPATSGSLLGMYK